MKSGGIRGAGERARLRIQKYSSGRFYFPHEVNINRIIDGVGLVCHMSPVNNQGDVSAEFLPFYANPDKSVSMSRSV